LHLVGILFPHINDNARSKSHQICLWMYLQQSKCFWGRYNTGRFEGRSSDHAVPTAEMSSFRELS